MDEVTGQKPHEALKILYIIVVVIAMRLFALRRKSRFFDRENLDFPLKAKTMIHITAQCKSSISKSANVGIGMKFLESFESANHSQEEAESVIRLGVNLFDFGQFAE